MQICTGFTGHGEAAGLEQLQAVSSTVDTAPQDREETAHPKPPAKAEKGRGRKEHKKHPDKAYSLRTFINKIDDLQHGSVDSVLREFSSG